MSQFERESLSALLDNEADDLELLRLLRSMETNPEFAQTWERYNLVQSLLHNTGVSVSSDLAAGIEQRIQDEPKLSMPGKPLFRWQQTLTKFAIAASVAAVFIFAFQSSLNNLDRPPLVQTSDSASAIEQIAPQSGAAVVVESSNFEVDPEAQQRLLEYIESMSFDEDDPVPVEHIQESSLYRLVNELQVRP
ncbi:MAG: sigma-E factor negative regulatory protein [Pseudomonadota bacterium]|nr:sigma-E factor negative regulatory protein [Pseudomonadota bacterium]